MSDGYGHLLQNLYDLRKERDELRRKLQVAEDFIQEQDLAYEYDKARAALKEIRGE